MAKPTRNGNKKHEETPPQDVRIDDKPPMEPATGTDVATMSNTLPSAPPIVMDEGRAALALLDELGETSEGHGISRSAEDIIIPSIMVLQGLSPQVDPGNPAFIEGARVGAIWMRNYSTPIVDGKEGAAKGAEGAVASEIDAEALTLSKTVEGHLNDITKLGTKARPYGDSRLVMKEIMEAGKAVPDPGGVPGGLRWDVPGAVNGSKGTWELELHP